MTVYSLQNLEANAGEMEELMQHMFSLELDLYGTGWQLLHVVAYGGSLRHGWEVLGGWASWTDLYNGLFAALHC